MGSAASALVSSDKTVSLHDLRVKKTQHWGSAEIQAAQGMPPSLVNAEATDNRAAGTELKLRSGGQA